MVLRGGRGLTVVDDGDDGPGAGRDGAFSPQRAEIVASGEHAVAAGSIGSIDQSRHHHHYTGPGPAGTDIVRLHQDQAEALRDLIKAKDALHQAQQAVQLLLGFAASLQSRCEALEAERDRAAAVGPGGREYAQLQARLARTERQLYEAERKLDRARHDRATAEGFAATAHAKAETAWLALEDAQRRAAEAEAAARAGGTGRSAGLPDTFGPAAPSEDEIDIALEQMEDFQDGLAASLKNLDHLFGPSRAPEEQRTTVPGRVVATTTAPAPVPAPARWQEHPVPAAPPARRLLPLPAGRKKKAPARPRTGAPTSRLGRAVSWARGGRETRYLLASLPAAATSAVTLAPLGAALRAAGTHLHQKPSDYFGTLLVGLALAVFLVAVLSALLNSTLHMALRPASWDFFTSPSDYDEEPWRRTTYAVTTAGVLYGLLLPAPSWGASAVLLAAAAYTATVALALLVWSVRKLVDRLT